MKKAFSKILSICMITSCIPCGILSPHEKASAATYSDDTAYVVFGKTDEASRLTVKKSSTGSQTQTIGGKTVLRIDRDKTTDRKYFGKINIDIDDDFFMGNSDGTEFAVTVEYLDYGWGHFNIHYDGINGESYTNIVYAGTTQKINKHTFIITDADFKNGLDGGYDLAVTFPYSGVTRSSKSAYIKSVSIEKRTAKNPVTAILTGTQAGHVFNYKYAPEFENELTNHTNYKQSFTVKYSAVNKLGSIDWVDTQTITLNPNEVKKVTVKPNIKKYGMYDLYAELSSSDYTATSQFSYVNTSRDGSKNERMLFCSHANAQNGTEWPLSTVDLLEKANAGGARGNLYWNMIEKTPGVYNYENTYGPMLEAFKKNGMKYIGVGGLGAARGVPWMALPEGETQTQAFVDYMIDALERYGTDTVLLEIWNEPNLKSFATNGSPELYADFAYESSKRIKAAYPSAKIGVLALAGVGTKNEATHKTSAFTEAAIQKGVFDYADAASFHPYAQGKPESTNLIGETINLMQKVWDAGYTGKKTWITEAGWTTARKSGSEFSERERAAYHPKYFILMDDEPSMEYYCIYAMMDAGSMADESEDCFGLVDYWDYPESGIPHLASEAYVTVANQNCILAGCDKPTKLSTGAESVFAYQYRNDTKNEDIIALWRDTAYANETVRLSLGDTSVTFVDAYGNETVLQNDSGVYDIAPDFDICYIVGNFENVSIEKSAMTISNNEIFAESNGTVEFSIEGISDATKAVINEKNFISQSVNVYGKKAEFEIELPELSNEFSSFYVTLKNGDKTTSVMRINLNRVESSSFEFFDDFSDYSYDIHKATNNRIDNWWIEQVQYGWDVSDYVQVQTITDKNGNTMEDALTLCPTADLSYDDKRMRGGRRRCEPLTPGGTVTVEFDIYAEDDANFGFGFRTQDGNVVEDGFGSTFFRVRPDGSYDKSKIYYSTTQNPANDPNKYFNGITFMRGEVNHVKAEYSLNDSADDTTDTLKLTVSNSSGENQTSTISTKFRSTTVANSKLRDIIGISFQKFDTDAYVYLDNFSMSATIPEYYLLNEDFSSGLAQWQTSTMNNISKNGWVNAPVDYTDKNGNIMDGAVYIGENEISGENNNIAWFRMARTWNQPIGAGESFTVEFDIAADDCTRVQVGLIPSDATKVLEPYANIMHLWSTKAKDTRASISKIYHSTDEGGDNVTYKNAYESVEFLRGEVNHIKLEYTMNKDVSKGTMDNITLTVKNSGGEKSTTKQMNFRTGSGVMLTGVKGINIYKARDRGSGTSGELYIDNLKVYKSNVTVPKAVINTDGIKAGAQTVLISFTKPMSETGVEPISISENGMVIDGVVKTLDSEKTVCTVTVPDVFKPGYEYMVKIPSNVYDAEGIATGKAVSAKFIPISDESSVSITQDGKIVELSKIDSEKAVTVNAVIKSEWIGKSAVICVAAYDKGNNLTDVKFTRVTATEKANTFTVNISRADTYKVFFWDYTTFKPLCSAL